MEGGDKFYAVNLEQRVKVPMLNCIPGNVMFAHAENETEALYHVFRKHVKIHTPALPFRKAVANSALEEFKSLDLEKQVYEMPTEVYVGEIKLDSHTSLYREKIREGLTKNIENKRFSEYSHEKCMDIASKILEAKRRHDLVEKNLSQEEFNFKSSDSQPNLYGENVPIQMDFGF